MLRINLRKVKDLVNNASILAIFSLQLCNFFAKFPLIQYLSKESDILLLVTL